MPRPTSFPRWFPTLHFGVRGLLRLLAPRWHVSGRRHIPRGGPVIFTPNHISDADPPLVAAALRFPVWFMAKRELWDIAWLAPILDYCQAFPVDPASPDRSALKFALDLLHRRKPVVVFPEGKISPTGELEEILPGAVLLALRAGVPVIPVGLAGAQHLIPYGSTRVHWTARRVRVHFGPPLDLADLRDLPAREAREEATRRLEAGIRAAVEVARRG